MNRIFGIHLDFLPQAANVHIHAARRHKAVSAPYGIEQLIARKHAVGAGCQIVNQTEFERAQRERLACPSDTVGGGSD